MSLQLTTLLFLCLFSGHHAYSGAAVMINSQEVEMQAELKRLNKLPIKTITTKEGDIIDCIDINQQPALDHPLLKNHKVQTVPQSFPAGITEGSFSTATLELKSGREACPYGTVPIHKIQKEDLVRVRSIPNGVLPFNRSTATDTGANKHAAFVYAPVKDGGIYHGGGGRLSIYSPIVADDQTSGAGVWAQNGHAGKNNLINTVAGGWMVSPEVNGGGHTRLFVYWTVDNGISTGCFDFLCPGFIQVNRIIGPKYIFSPTSCYGGAQYDFGIFVYKSNISGDWWLAMSVIDEAVVVPIGYWPSEILSGLKNGASRVSWGGFTGKAGSNKINPAMGSGHLPDGDCSHAAYFTDVVYVDQVNLLHPLPEADAGKFADRPVCYDLQLGPGNCKGRDVGFGILFGGPGGSCDDQ